MFRIKVYDVPGVHITPAATETLASRPVMRAPGTVQMNLVLADVRNISATATEAVPPGSDIDLSALTDAEKSIKDGIQTAQERQTTVRKYLNVVRKVIFIVGACSFAVGILGFLTLLARVRFSWGLILLATRSTIRAENRVCVDRVPFSRDPAEAAHSRAINTHCVQCALPAVQNWADDAQALATHFGVPAC